MYISLMAKKKKKGKFPRKGLSKTALKGMVLKEMSKNPGKSYNYKQLCEILGIKDSNERKLMIQTLGILKAEGRLLENQRGLFSMREQVNQLSGTISFAPSGAAFVSIEGLEQDVFISPKNTKKALDGDTVKLVIFARRKGKRPEGEVLEILHRKREVFVGIIEVSRKFAFVVPDNPRVSVDLFIPLEKLNGAEHGQKVVAKITDWPQAADSPFGEIVEILGAPGDLDTEIHAILTEYGLPYDFPEEVEAEANRLATEISEEDIASRRDMRHVPTFTIDPEDAKDFDDALSLQALENGLYEVGIHIADVSHYMQPGTVLDNEAYERATSVYLVDRVVPMLPEILSNQACSLRPDEEKLCFSAIFHMDKDGLVKKEWFGRTVILSNRRFTYEEAQEIIEGKDGDMQEAIRLMDVMAKKMRGDRLKHGAITFDKIEVKFRLDEKNHPTGVYFKVSKDANKLIEEFMLLANRKVAEFIGKQTKLHKSFVYRVHDDPDEQKLNNFSQFLKKFGYTLRLGSRKVISDSLNKVLEEVKGKGEENMVETLAVRSMSKAIYTTENIGHYGLAFDYYTHFTSPIRRYPDVMVHRLLQHYLDNGSPVDQEKLEFRCKHTSEREKLASEAERSSIRYMQVEYMKDKIGQVFEGVISGVTDYGIFVELRESRCEGLIRIANIQDDYYVFDEKNYLIKGELSGNVYQLGDKVTIRVKHADLVRKQLDFELAIGETPVKQQEEQHKP